MADVSISKSAQKNKKRREKKQHKEATVQDVVEKDTINEEPATPVVQELNPIEVIKQKIEEAKLAKDHKKAQQLREQLWALQDQAAGKTVKDAPEIDPTLFQSAIKVESKPKVTVVANDESNDKRLKQLRKKLDQITKLKEKQEKGETLEQNQLAKLATEQDILDEISAIEEVYKQLTLR